MEADPEREGTHPVFRPVHQQTESYKESLAITEDLPGREKSSSEERAERDGVIVSLAAPGWPQPAVLSIECISASSP